MSLNVKVTVQGHSGKEDIFRFSIGGLFGKTSLASSCYFFTFFLQTLQDFHRLSPMQFTPPDATKLDSFVAPASSV